MRLELAGLVGFWSVLLWGGVGLLEAAGEAVPVAAPGGGTAGAAAGPVSGVEGEVGAEAWVEGLSTGEVQEALRALKDHYVDSRAFSDEALQRATLAGLLVRLKAGVLLGPGVPEAQGAGPVRAEILDDRIGYVRLGALGSGAIAEMDAALGGFAAKGLRLAILDLRATGPSSEFELAAEVAKRFSEKGRLLFAVRKPGVKQELIFTSNQEPRFRGLLVVAVDGDTAGAAEVVAEALRVGCGALVVGERTQGRAAEYREVPLQQGRALRVAVSEVVFPGNRTISPGGVEPDLVVEVDAARTRELLAAGLEKGVTQLVLDEERPKLNEAALLAGTNPEFEAFAEARRGDGESKPPMRDPVLQKAVDVLTTLAIYEGRAEGR